MSDETKKTETKRFTKEEVDAGLMICHREYMMNILGVLAHDEETHELNYSKCAIIAPNGGEYLVSILHISGPKLIPKELGIVEKATDEKKT